jgi:hypothetical protein
MKRFVRVAALALSLLAGAAAQATTYNFSYTFGDGNKATGSFDGTTVGDLVVDLSHISVSVNGVAFPHSGALSSYFFTPEGDWAGHAVASFNAVHNNFGFFDDDPSTGAATHGFLLVPYGPPDHLAQILGTAGEPSEWTVPANWTLTAVVPEAETYAMLLVGLGLIGVVARRRAQA